MTIRIPVSSIFNRWYDGQKADQVDMTVEQNKHLTTDAAIIQNHFGSGVLLHAPTQNKIFDTEDLFADQAALIISNDFDGTGLRPLNQPLDSTLGNQLEVELLDSDIRGASGVGGRLSTKVLIIGLDFQGNLQLDRFYFYRKEKQATKKHYTKVLGVFFNDFLGNNNCSRTLNGRIIIREVKSYQLTRDAIMIAQDVEPDIFFRDFKCASAGLTLHQTIQIGIGAEYNVDSLYINTTPQRELELGIGDVVTRISEKFIAKTNNIQKITILLGVRRDDAVDISNRYDWGGELIVSFYELQSSVSCPTDIVPELAIEFDPNPDPIIQFSIDQDDLRDLGYVLSDVLQPIDLVFNNSILGDSNNTVLIPGKHYAMSIGRAGDASVGTIFTGVGNSKSTDDRLSVFTGNWTDNPNEDLWYQVWSNTAKVADGLGYDNGNGIEITKTELNNLGAVIDYVEDQVPFANTGQNILNIAIVEAITEQSKQEQDERTGNPVYARQKFEPNISFVTESGLATLRLTGEPVILGCARDTNPKSNQNISGIQPYIGLSNGNTFTILNPDADLLTQQLLGSALIPNDDCQAIEYKIVDVKLCTDGYGDINGDGIVDALDVFRVSQLVGESLYLQTTQQKILNGDISTLELIRADVNGDGYITSEDVNIITAFAAKSISTFPVGDTYRRLDIKVQNQTGRFDSWYDCCDGYIRLDGYNIVNIDDLNSYEYKYYGWNGLPDISLEDVIFTTTPFNPVPFRIRASAYWKDFLVQFRSEAREVPAVFSYTETDESLINNDGNCGTSEDSICNEMFVLGGVCNPGKNDFYIPNNLILNNGQIITKNGSLHKQDFEVHLITLEIPNSIDFVLHRGILDVFNKLVVDSGDGYTVAGYSAARFADCSTVGPEALVSNQIRFGVSIQSITPNFDGEDPGLGFGVVSNDILAISIDQNTGIMYISMKDVDNNVIYPEISTKILISIYLKKAGWNNNVIHIAPSQFAGLLSSNNPYP